MSKITPNMAILIKPDCFSFNEQTAKTNSFQKHTDYNMTIVSEQAKKEFNNLVKKLSSMKIPVLVFPEAESIDIKPDSVFSNNWIVYMPNGNTYTMPMLTQNRKLEVDSRYILGEYQTKFQKRGGVLEGTGSMVLDHANKKIYAAISKRTSLNEVVSFAKEVEYELISFDTLDSNGQAIYHTNVLMSIGETYAVICKDVIVDSRILIESLERDGKEIIYITEKQMRNFCGNIFELKNIDDKLVTMCSLRAMMYFTHKQLESIYKHSLLVPVNVETIENVGGGSVRCMITGIFT